MRTLKYLIPFLLASICAAQGTPNCVLNFAFDATHKTSSNFPNSTPGCDKWTLLVYNAGFGSFTVTLQSALAATTTTPGSFGTYTGTTATGTNPLTTTSISTFTNGTVATPWLRVVFSGTGGGSVYGVLQGSQTVISKGGGGGGGGSGDPCTQAISAIPSGLHCVTVTMSQADILTTDSAPFVVIPAPGAGNVVFPFAYRWRFNFVSQPYQTNPSNVILYFWWQGNTNAFGSIAGISLFGQSSTAAYFSGGGIDGFFLSGGPQNPAIYTNQPIVMQPTLNATYNAGPITSAAVGSNCGTGYAPGDQFAISDYTSDGVLTVATVGAGGCVTGITIATPGTNSVPGTNLDTQNVSGSGIGLTVNIGALVGDGTLTITIWYTVAAA